MEENKIWANLNDSYNIDVILIENKNINSFLPKKDILKTENKKITENSLNLETNINNILINNYDNDNYLEIIKKQNQIIIYLNKFYNKCTNINWSEIRPYLIWILESSKFLIKDKIKIQLFKTDKIYRSSYKFCNKKDECNTFYKKMINCPSNNRCNGDHYIHNKLISDINCLITVLDNDQTNITNDLRICLETFSFVINHMFNELNTFNIYYSKESNFNINKYYIINYK
jgi:hypothetical protein